MSLMVLSPRDCGSRPKEGVRPVRTVGAWREATQESGCLGMQP